MKKPVPCGSCGAVQEHPFCEGPCGRDLFLIPIVAAVNVAGVEMYFCSDCKGSIADVTGKAVDAAEKRTADFEAAKKKAAEQVKADPANAPASPG